MHTPTNSRRHEWPQTSSSKKPQVQWLETGRLIDSLIEDLVESDEPTTLGRGSSGPSARARAPHSASRVPVASAVRTETEDSTDVMTSLPAWDPEPVEDRKSAYTAAPTRASKILCVMAPPPVKAPAPRPEPTTAHRAPAPSRPSLSRIDTALLTLSPALLRALKLAAPKKRRSKIPYVLGLAVAAFVAVLAADVSTRSFIVEKAHEATAFVQL